MMKFKSLFRRGQPTQPQQQPTQPQQQQQQSPLRQAPSASSLEAKSDSQSAGNWSCSLGKEGSKGNSKGNYNSKGPAKGSRMQELEREIDDLRKERARLENNLRDASCDVHNLQELRDELASLKVTCPVNSYLQRNHLRGSFKLILTLRAGQILGKTFVHSELVKS